MKFTLLLAVALVGCAAKKPVAAAKGVEIDVPIPCLTQPVRLLGCDLTTLKCRQALIQHRKDCEEIKVTDGKTTQ